VADFIVPESLFSPTAVDFLVTEVAGLLHEEDDPSVRTKALAALDRAADRMNSRGVYVYTRTQETYDSLVEGDSTVVLPSDFGWPMNPVQILDANNQVTGIVEWLNWDEFSRRQTYGVSSGKPYFISILDGSLLQATVYPAVGAGQVSKLVIPYARRIPRPSQSDQLLILPEVREALITGGQALILQYRYPDKPGVWQPMLADFIRQTQLAKASGARLNFAARPRARVDLMGRPDETSLSYWPLR
jgi:hypothetical protein